MMMSKGKKVLVGLILTLLILTVAAYGFGVYYFTKHFLPGSMVNGFNFSYMTEKEADDLMAQKAEAYVLAIRTRNNGQESITAEQAGLKYTPDGSTGRLIYGQNRFLWFLSFTQHQNYELSGANTYDQDKLTLAVNGLRCMQQQNMIMPRDAFIKENDTGYEIVPEVQGSKVDGEKLYRYVAAAVSTGNPELDLEQADCYEKPQVYQDDPGIVKNCRQMNELTDVVITYDFGDRAETVDKDVIKNWLKRDEQGDIILDPEKVAVYVNELGYKYDTFGCTREFTTYDGRQIYVEGGDYGWAIDQKAETEALIRAVESGVTQVREPVYSYTGLSRNTNDIGYTYIEVDLTNQRMVYYQDGFPMVDTYVVTGNPNIPGMETPTGCFAVDAMKSPAVLTGDGYESEVTYWIPFCGNVGIHDAAWRSQFGGNIYLTDGSHGCVNTPYEKAQQIYQNIDIGIPVIVHK